MRLNSIGVYKINSIFIKTLLILILLSVVLVVMFYYFAVHIISENFKDKAYTSHMNTLSNLSNSIDLTFYNIAHSMRQASQNQYIVSAMITPNSNNYQRNLNIFNQLRNVSESNNLIKDAFLFTSTDNMIYSSDGGISKFEDFQDEDMSKSVNIPAGTSIANGEIATDVKTINGRIILCQHFFPLRLKQVGSIIFEINTSQLYKAILNSDENNIFIFDENNNPIFSEQIDYSKFNFKNQLDFDRKVGDFSVRNYDGSSTVFFFFQSDQTHWKYIYAVNNSSLDFDFFATTKLVLPFVLIFLMLSILLSLYMTMNIYKPISNLMMSIPQSDQEITAGYDKNAKDELDFFCHRYTEAVIKNNQLSTSIESIAPAVLERLFYNLLVGHQISDASIQETLDRVGWPSNMTVCYVVLIISVLQANGREIPEEKMSQYATDVNNTAKSSLENKASHCMVRTGNSTITFVLGFDHSVSVMETRYILTSLYSNIAAKARKLHYNISFGRGNVCSYITDLKYSYLEAKEQIDNKTLEDDTAEKELEETDTSGVCYDDHYFVPRIKHIFLRIKEDDSQQAMELMKRIISEIFSNTADVNFIKRNYELFINNIIEEMIELKVNSVEKIICAKKEMDGRFASGMSLKEMEEQVRIFCTQIIELIDAHNRKPQYQYIQAAKEYIDTNYSDTELSLQIVAEHIGINQSYLSKLFGEMLNLHFTDYLNEVRVEKIKELLCTTELSIKEISYRSGFSSIQNFFRVFKKYQGISPKQYRQINK